MEAGAATGSRRGWQLWALLPILLLVGAVSLFATAGGSDRRPRGLEPAAGRRARHPAGVVRAGPDRDSGDEPAA